MSIEKLVEAARKARFLNVEAVPLDESIVRAVLLAMREPTPGMIEAAIYGAGPIGCCNHIPETARETWQVMIDCYFKDQNNAE